MNSTGIIRKVDELGRIVIPIELRKTLNIKSGDILEFNVNSNSLSLTKISMPKTKLDLIKSIHLSLSNTIDGDYIISDREKVLFSTNNRMLNLDMIHIIDSLIKNRNEYTVISHFYDSKDGFAFPYYYENEIAGYIILYNINDVSQYTKMINFIVKYINCNISIS